MAYPISRGKVQTAQKVIVYGPEGIGKSTFAAQFPEPLFIDTEGSTKHMDVARYPKPSSWAMLLEEVAQIKNSPGVCKTLVIDTADWAEALCISAVCARAKKGGIEDFGYGKGYVYVAEEFGKLLNLLEDIVNSGINIVITAHAKMRKFEQPDEMGAYDRWEMKLSKNTAPLVKEWADMVLFANYKTIVITTDDKKNKAQGGSRVMYTTHHVCWDAKNRHSLPDELPFSYSGIAHIFGTPAQSVSAPPEPQVVPVKAEAQATSVVPETPTAGPIAMPNIYHSSFAELQAQGIPTALADLMVAEKVEPDEIQKAVAGKGYYPEDTPISNYDPAFIQGVLINAWKQVLKMVLDNRDMPF